MLAHLTPYFQCYHCTQEGVREGRGGGGSWHPDQAGTTRGKKVYFARVQLAHWGFIGSGATSTQRKRDHPDPQGEGGRGCGNLIYPSGHVPFQKDLAQKPMLSVNSRPG